MKRSRIQTLNLRRKTVTKDSEGVTTPVWGSATQIQAEVWPAGGQLQVQTYGDRVNSMMNVRVRGSYQVITEGNHQAYKFKDFTLCEGDGICLYAEPTGATGASGASGASGATGASGSSGIIDPGPDYRIISIAPYKPLRMEIEKI